MGDHPELFDVGPRQPAPRKRGTATAAPIGTGPAGEFCRSCRHAIATGKTSKNYYKCNLVRHLWTHGAGSDIKLRWPACNEWAAKTP